MYKARNLKKRLDNALKYAVLARISEYSVAQKSAAYEKIVQAAELIREAIAIIHVRDNPVTSN